MVCRVRFHTVGFAVLVALAGCGRSLVTMGERAEWRQEAEAACMQSGAVHEGAGIVRIEPIEGPGVCGASFPLRVAALGDSGAIGFGEEPIRPPGAVPGGTVAERMPRFPAAGPGYPPPSVPRYAPPSELLSGPPVSLMPPDVAPQPGIAAPQTYEPQGYTPRAYTPQVYAPRGMPRTAPVRIPDAGSDNDIPDDATVPDRARGYPQRQTYAPPARDMSREVPRLGPMRGPPVTGSLKTAITPPATLACPIVSALDRWVIDAVQPAAMRWFGQPVTEIKQISAYSCRGMVGSATPHVSEHAFGNALDIAAFVLADGRRVTVKSGWDGTPEETGFLHDVQLAACERFTTVLGPGYNVYHYDHIHVDLIQRRSGRVACKPRAIAGEIAAARQMQKTRYARRGEQIITGSIAKTAGKLPDAIPGQDGYFEDE